ncbi:hypothetical protein CVO77_13645 [Sphingopyxis lindanitolerans]|uniref:Flavivirus NS2B domain-containing protein n=1 Tax=Sphingopyxis lindanitolerans TaxID=2054227 RepID=A0A2S8B165_9SPHN|nr:DUF192 domain-containing protein [Sphingopyxis lindanitolerans]PQM26122.1 hypothetical protein CVO77_13645 [Sphingopyxis lindanitolerans]
MRILLTALALSLALPMAACSRDGGAAQNAVTIPLTIAMAGKAHAFNVEVARSADEQERGLMFRTSLPADGGMLFPFAKPKIASFWMKNTLIPLDMIFVRADGSIDRIAENAIPESLEPVVSGGEVAAVLELTGGTATKLGLDESAKVTWKETK